MAIEETGGQVIQTTGGPELHGPRSGAGGTVPNAVRSFAYRAHLPTAHKGEGWECVEIQTSVAKMRGLIERVNTAGLEWKPGDMEHIYVACSIEQAEALLES